jgi:hypothetical protein
VVRKVGEAIRVRDRRHSVGDGLSHGVAVREPSEGGGIPATLETVEELFEHELAVTAHYEVHVRGAQADVPVLGGEVAAPDHRQAWAQLLEPSAGRYGACELWARHDCHGQRSRAPLTDESVDGGDGVGLEVAVH